MAKKSIFKICFIIAAVSALGATGAFAATSISTPTVLGGGTFSPSKSVTINVATGNGTNTTCAADSTASNPCNSYGARSKHNSGDRILATTNSEPKTYFSTVDISASVGDASITEDFTSGWTAL